jgi:putative acetyltransferase
MKIRRYQPGEEQALFEVYHSAIHEVASRDYSPAQLDAWAPADLDRDLWTARIRGINPFVADIDGVLVGYADVQDSGYIDHFFVSGRHPRQGIGRALMQAIEREAERQSIKTLSSDVSRTAQPFFESFGFVVVEQRRPVVRGIELANALMQKLR